MNNPLVSIACITYNHKKYIADAIKGFLIQKTNFPIEIIIHDDASTDSTADIIREYEKKYPELIKPIYQKENQYSKGVGPVLNFVWPKCSGKYIALCEGDDYWTDPYKLQKQVDFLENNPDFVMSFHKIRVLKNNKIIDDYFEDKIFKGTVIPKSKDSFDTDDLSYGNFIYTCSVVFRNIKSVYVDNEVLRKSPAGDYVLYLYLSLHGKIKLQNDCMGVYRIHEGGVWSMKDDREKSKQLLELLIDNFKHESRTNFINRYVYVLLRCMIMNLRKGRIYYMFQNYSDGLKRVDNFPKKLSQVFIKKIKSYFVTV